MTPNSVFPAVVPGNQLMRPMAASANTMVSMIVKRLRVPGDARRTNIAQHTNIGKSIIDLSCNRCRFLRRDKNSPCIRKSSKDVRTISATMAVTSPMKNFVASGIQTSLRHQKK
jgi:hypothetical protein